MHDRIHIRANNFDTLLLLILFYFGLLILVNNTDHKPVEKRTATETGIVQYSVIPGNGVPLHLIRQSWVSTREICSFIKITYSENRKADLKISLLAKNVESTFSRNLLFIFHRHLFASEPGEPPLLS
jgi:uncharacterized membrane protein